MTLLGPGRASANLQEDERYICRKIDARENYNGLICADENYMLTWSEIYCTAAPCSWREEKKTSLLFQRRVTNTCITSDQDMLEVYGLKAMS